MVINDNVEVDIFLTGWNGKVSPDLRTLIGHSGRTFEEFCSDYGDHFREEYLKYCMKIR